MTAPHHTWRRRDARAVYEMHAGPNMTPMVDVVMVILIFFMASTVIVGPELFLRAGLDRTAAPPGEGAAVDPAFAIEPPTFTVRVHVEEGSVVVSGLGLESNPLRQVRDAAAVLMREVAGTEVSIVVVPEGEVPYEAVIAVQDALTEAGFDEIKLR